MSSKTQHRLLVFVFILCAVILAVLLFLEPVLGLLWLALVVVGCLITHGINPQLWQQEKARWQSRRAQRQAEQDSQGDRYKTDFTPDHMLVCLSSPGHEAYLVDSDTYVLGRSPDCNLVITQSKTVGNHHCRILYRHYSHSYYLEDLRSLNGTYLGTRRLEPFKQEKLMDGMELSISQCKYQFVRCQER